MIAAPRSSFDRMLALSIFAGLSLFADAAPPTSLEFRRHALTHEGDAERGKSLFLSPALACAQCHSVDGSASKAGPDLFSVGDAFGRQDLIDAILQPSLNIAPGYGTFVVETVDGKAYQGVIKGATDSELQLMGPDGRRIDIPTGSIKSRTGSEISMMPEGIHAGLSLQEFTDLIDYLTSLRQEESTLASHHGMPLEIASLTKPVTVRPFFAAEFSLPRKGQETGLSSFRQIPGSGDAFLVLHQRGMIWKAQKTASGEDRSIFADLTGIVFSQRGPNGLLDVAFHPNFRENRKYYLFYQIFENGKAVSQIVEKEFDSTFHMDSGKPGRVLLRIVSVAEDHSGGCLQFGPDGFLYIVMGDTGPHHDPAGNAQNLRLLLGKLLRIDVDHLDEGLPYAIPTDNPFIGKASVRPEIWAYGFRNPWRFSFDKTNGDLWLADVGQDRVEEVAIVKRGENHGWNVYEAFEPFSNQYRKAHETYIKPIFAYRRKYGNSVTGGYVYRGDRNSSFNGVYVCGDYTSKKIFGLTIKDGQLQKVRHIGTSPQLISSFAEDEAGELYVVGFEGTIYQIDFADAVFE
jgi:putative heme-binding domain-containing protein